MSSSVSGFSTSTRSEQQRADNFKRGISVVALIMVTVPSSTAKNKRPALLKGEFINEKNRSLSRWRADEPQQRASQILHARENSGKRDASTARSASKRNVALLVPAAPGLKKVTFNASSISCLTRPTNPDAPANKVAEGASGRTGHPGPVRRGAHAADFGHFRNSFANFFPRQARYHWAEITGIPGFVITNLLCFPPNVKDNAVQSITCGGPNVKTCF